MIPRLRASLFPLIFGLAVLSFPLRVAGQAETSKYLVKVAVADMHAGPSEETEVVSQAVLSSEVDMLETKGEWAKVRTNDDYTGWMPLRDVVVKVSAAKGKTAQVASLFAHIYREPDVTARQPLMTAPFEARLVVLEEMTQDGDRWLKVRLPDGAVGFVQRGDITFEPKPLTIVEAIEQAKRFLGFPYTWGGRSSYGYDCSGFMQMLMRLRGMTMPRDAGPQATWSGSVLVKREELLAGDLLYFGTPDKITHTGMYIGNGQFIHSTTHDRPMVQVSHLDDEPWTRALMACRRVK